MIYNLALPLDRKKFSERGNYLYTKKCFVELKEHKPRRSIPQNSYLHLILQYLALQLGETLQYVKDEYYKKTCNRDIFIFTKYDPQLQRNTDRLRSSRELTTEEMSISIDRFKDWSAQHGYYLPDAMHPEEIIQAQQEIERERRYAV